MKKQLNTPNLSSKKGPEESIRTIQKQPNPPTNISESTPKEDFKEKSLEIFPLLTNRNAQHSSKDNENLSEFRTEIEKKYKKSVMNKIYSFPKTRDCFSENSSMDSLKSVEVYDLSCQNFERKNCFEMKSSSPFRDNSNPQEKNPFLFDKELEKLNKEIEYYKNHRLRTLSREKDNERENHFRPNGISQRKTEGLMSKERPNYIKLLNLLEENNDLDLKKSENKHRTPSNSQSCLRKRDISSKKTPNRIKTEKTPCPFDKKIAKTFENCCEIKENLELNIESSNYRSISRGRQLEESRSKSKTKQNLLDKRILSPISYTYMNKFLIFVF